MSAPARVEMVIADERRLVTRMATTVTLVP
jgi:hypothetical protein